MALKSVQIEHHLGNNPHKGHKDLKKAHHKKLRRHKNNELNPLYNRYTDWEY